MAASGRDRRAGRSEELQRVGGVLREAMDTDRFRRGLALGRLARSWGDVVGSRLAQETAPFSLEQGGLVVSVSTAAWGAQVRFLAHEIRRRANEVLGGEEVRTVRIAVGRTERRGRGDYGG
jgi:predicted nucleic acid-binding Zn ribbon protein